MSHQSKILTDESGNGQSAVFESDSNTFSIAGNDFFSVYHQPEKLLSLTNDGDPPNDWEIIQRKDYSQKIDITYYREQLEKAASDFKEVKSVPKTENDLVDRYPIHPGSLDYEPEPVRLNRASEQKPLDSATINFIEALEHNRRVKLREFMENVTRKDIPSIIRPSLLWGPSEYEVLSSEALMLNTTEDDFVNGKKILEWLAQEINEETVTESDFAAVQSYLQLHLVEERAVEREEHIDKWVSRLKLNNTVEQVEMVNSMFKSFSEEFLSKEEIELRDIQLEIVETKEKLKYARDESSEYNELLERLDSLKASRLEYIADDQLWFDEELNIVDKEEADLTTTNAIRKELSKLEALLNRNDFSSIQLKFFQLYNRYQVSEDLKESAEENLSGYFSPGANDRFIENTKSFKEQARALALFVATQQDPSKLANYGFMRSVDEGFIEAFTGNDHMIVSPRDLVTDALAPLQELGLDRPQDLERAEGTTGERYGYITGGVVELIAETIIIELVTAGLGAEVAIANAFNRIRRIAILSKTPIRTIKKINQFEKIITPYLIRELNSTLVGQEFGAASMEKSLEDMFEKNILDNYLSRMGKWGKFLLKPIIKGSSDAVIGEGVNLIFDQFNPSNPSQQNIEEVAVGYAMSIVMEMAGGIGAHNKVEFEKRLLDIESNNSVVIDAQNIIWNYEKDVAAFELGKKSFQQKIEHNNSEISDLLDLADKSSNNKNNLPTLQYNPDLSIKGGVETLKNLEGVETYAVKIVDTDGVITFAYESKSVYAITTLLRSDQFKSLALKENNEITVHTLNSSVDINNSDLSDAINDIFEEQSNRQHSEGNQELAQNNSVSSHAKSELANSSKVNYTENIIKLMARHELPPPEEGYYFREINSPNGNSRPSISSKNLQKYPQKFLEKKSNGEYNYERVDKEPTTRKMSAQDFKNIVVGADDSTKSAAKIMERSNKATILIEAGYFSEIELQGIIENAIRYDNKPPAELLDNLHDLMDKIPDRILYDLTKQLAYTQLNGAKYKGAEFTIRWLAGQDTDFLMKITGFEIHNKDANRFVDLIIGGVRYEFKNVQNPFGSELLSQMKRDLTDYTDFQEFRGRQKYILANIEGKVDDSTKSKVIKEFVENNINEPIIQIFLQNNMHYSDRFIRDQSLNGNEKAKAFLESYLANIVDIF